MKKLRYVKTTDRTQFVDLPIINNYEITKSSQEVSYSDLTCDFTNKTASDLPEKYQEVQIIDDNNKINYFGYIDSYNFNEMREIDKFTEINFTLLSPMKLATLRTFIAVGTYDLLDLIQNIILKPLINDGFEIEKLDIIDRSVTVNFLSNTIEYGMSTLSNQFNIWWFIDEQKKIYVQIIDEILNKKPAQIYDDTHKITGLQYLRPTIESDNYANVVNFSNVRVYEQSEVQFSHGDKIYELTPLIKEQVFNMKKGDQILFRHPVDLKQENILKSGRAESYKVEYVGLEIIGYYTDSTMFRVYINNYNDYRGTWITSDNVGFKGDEQATQDFLLIRDNFFSNLIVGFEYNGNKTIDYIRNISSDSALVWEIFKFYNDRGIDEKKEIISKTGIIETTVDMNETWKTIPELQEIGKTFIDKNSLQLDGEIELKLDKDVFKVGDIVKIDKMLFNGNYIVTSIQETFNNKILEYFVKCKNANIINNYIELFRNPISEVSDDKIYQVNISHYVEEGINETFEVIN